MKWIRILLFPIVPVYYCVTRIRNLLFDLKIKQSTKFDLPVICVGNLSVGGTGKTPMIEYLIRLLNDKYTLATLSRGYKRSTKGFQLASTSSSARTLGDEPYQFYNKFKNSISVAVDGDRVNGIKQLLKLQKKPQIILLDDAFQHRRVTAGFNILLTTFNNPYFKDIMLPTGDLREPKNGSKRADVIVVTKCPDTMSLEDKAAYRSAIAPLKHQHVFFSTITYAETIHSKSLHIALKTFNNFTLVTGIANASPLVSFLKHKGLDFDHLNYKDHYEFNDTDIALFKTKEKILTTEKDFMRLRKYKNLENKLFYLPITINIDAPDTFKMCLENYITKTL